MNRKTLHSMWLALILAPALLAQVPVPTRPSRTNIVVPANGPAQVTATNQAATNAATTNVTTTNVAVTRNATNVTVTNLAVTKNATNLAVTNMTIKKLATNQASTPVPPNQTPRRMGPSLANSNTITANQPGANQPVRPPGRRAPAPAPAMPGPTPNPPPFTPPTMAPTTIPPAVLAAEDLRGKPEPADIYYNFPGVPIDQLLDIYADLVGRTLLRATAGASAVPTTTTITLKTQTKLTRSEAIIALETILGMNGITIVPIGDKFAKIVTEAGAPEAGGLISTNTNNIPEAGKMITQIVQLKYVDPKDLEGALTPFTKAPKSIIIIPSTGTLILRDYAENVSRMLEMVRKIDVLTPNSVKPEVIPIKYALASDISSALSSLGAGGGGSVGKSTSGASFKGGTGTTSTGGGFGGTSGGIGGSSYPGQSTQGTSGLSSSATSGRSTFQNNLQSIVKNAQSSGQFQLFGQTKIIADERTNSLLVFANDEDMKMIKLIISKLDVVLAQVLIDAIILEINLDDDRTTGVAYGTQNGGANHFSGVGGFDGAQSILGAATAATNGTATAGSSPLASLPGGFSYFGRYGNDINVALTAVADNSRINVLSRPRIQTSHAVQADLFIGNTVPYVTGTYNYGYGSGPSSQYTQLEVGIHLQILPLINPDGLVVMDIQADVEQLGPDVQIAGVGGVPTTTKRQAGAKVAVRNGETVMLGGFISDSRSKSISGIPGLMNIPGLGNLFRSTTINNLRTELVMLIRPTVLATPEVAAVVATTERNKLSGVKQAELEIRTDEAKRNLKIERDMADEAAKEAAAQKKAAEKAAKKRKSGAVDASTNTIPISSIPALEDQ